AMTVRSCDSVPVIVSSGPDCGGAGVCAWVCGKSRAIGATRVSIERTTILSSSLFIQMESIFLPEIIGFWIEIEGAGQLDRLFGAFLMPLYLKFVAVVYALGRDADISGQGARLR